MIGRSDLAVDSLFRVWELGYLLDLSERLPVLNGIIVFAADGRVFGNGPGRGTRGL